MCGRRPFLAQAGIPLSIMNSRVHHSKIPDEMRE